MSFTVPYLVNDDAAGLGAKVGFIFAALVILGAVWTFYFVPELKGRALEEIDEMFQQKIPSRKFKEYQVTGVASLVEVMEQNGTIPVGEKTHDMIHVEIASQRTPASSTSEKVER